MENSARSLGWAEEKCRAMFLLGYLHDIGYEFSDVPNEHPFVGGELLKAQQYPYWREILYHGCVDCEYTSAELDLLNAADLSVNAQGENVGAIERLTDIANRYGENSRQHLNAKTLARKLKLI
jgi:predicted hydrolase (HD superfamily)